MLEMARVDKIRRDANFFGRRSLEIAMLLKVCYILSEVSTYLVASFCNLFFYFKFWLIIFFGIVLDDDAKLVSRNKFIIR